MTPSTRPSFAAALTRHLYPIESSNLLSTLFAGCQAPRSNRLAYRSPAEGAPPGSLALSAGSGEARKVDGVAVARDRRVVAAIFVVRRERELLRDQFLLGSSRSTPERQGSCHRRSDHRSRRPKEFPARHDCHDVPPRSEAFISRGRLWVPPAAGGRQVSVDVY